MCWLPQGSTCIRFFPALPVPTVVQPLYRQDAQTTQGCFVHGLKLRSSCTWTKLLFCQTVPYDTSDRNTFIYPLRFLLLLYTCGCFACKCICAPCVYDTLRDYQMPWYTVSDSCAQHGWGIEPGSSGKGTSALTAEPSQLRIENFNFSKYREESQKWKILYIFA